MNDAGLYNTTNTDSNLYVLFLDFLLEVVQTKYSSSCKNSLKDAV